jgi:hypothetical protein
VVLNVSEGLEAVRDPGQLTAGPEYEIRLAKGKANVKLSDVQLLKTEQ